MGFQASTSDVKHRHAFHSWEKGRKERGREREGGEKGGRERKEGGKIIKMQVNIPNRKKDQR